jgi:DNA-directed RNA polymerase subunit RPC12/RpoP
MIKRVHTLLDDADVVIHYNGSKFDIPTLNVEFVKLGLHPPATYKQLDLYQVVKSNFRFASNKLEHVANEFRIGTKKKHEGHTLWVKCMAGDPVAWQDMEEYNEQDVRLLERLYAVLLPWAKPALNVGVYDDNNDRVACPSCGGHVQKRGFAYTNLSKFQRYQCVTCGAWSRGRENLKDRTNVAVPIA